MKNLIIYFGFVFAIVSCSNIDQDTITQIEEWQTKLDSAHQVYLKVDFDSLNKINWKVNENERAIKRLNSADTIYTDMVKDLDDYKWIRKKLKNVDSKRHEYGTEFKEIKVQLEDLKLDVQNGLRTPEENQQYLSNEIEAIKKLFAKFSKDHIVFEKAITEYARLNERVQDYVDKIKRDKGIIK